MVSELQHHSLTPYLFFIQVPVIAIFTKMDALDERAFNQLLNEGASFEEADRKAPSLAKDIFERSYDWRE
jgi:GTP-binding protein EngB required for normal cell division